MVCGMLIFARFNFGDFCQFAKFAKIKSSRIFRVIQYLISPVAASSDPDSRLAWLHEGQKKWDPSIKQRAAGKEL
jgi:hypothetical protein